MKLALILLAALIALAIVALAIFVFVVQDVERPDYAVVDRDGAFELRDYPRMIVAETMVTGTRRDALGDGFGYLARYIFARDRAGDRIAMTAPVEQQALRSDAPVAMTAPVMQLDSGDGAWRVRFVMPSRYDLAELPAPGGDQVTLRELAPQRVAAIRFDGRADDAALSARERDLRDWLAQRGLAARGEAVYAFYNDPLTPGFLRRNEVQIAVAADAEAGLP
jgi:hypothetical protein